MKRSDNFTKWNCGDDHRTISSAKRETWTAQRLAAASVSTAKSRSETASSELAAARVEAEGCRGHGAVDRKGGAGERGCAERALVEALACIGEAAAVASEHLDIGEEMVAEGDRLRGLQMGEPGHDRRGVLERLLGKRAFKIAKRCVDVVDGVAHPQAEVGRHLVVPRAGRMKPARCRADQLGKPGLDVEVDVLERAREDEFACFDFSRYRV